MVGPCACCGGVLHGQTNSFSVLFPNIPNHSPFDETAAEAEAMYYPSSVDCTLSLGTPSTRLINADDAYGRRSERRRSISSQSPSMCAGNSNTFHHKGSRSSAGGGTSIGGGGSGNDPLLARRCANCDTTSTPLWRNGPRGPKSLCNACGIRFKKEERRAAATGNSNGSAAAAMAAEQMSQYDSSFVQHYSTAINANDFRFINDDDGRDSDNGMSFLSWRLNVADRASLVHGFTR